MTDTSIGLFWLIVSIVLFYASHDAFYHGTINVPIINFKGEDNGND